MSKNHLKLISAWQPFAAMLKSLWDQPTDDYHVADEAEVKERIWDGVVTAIERRRHRRRIILHAASVAACVACLAVAAVWVWRPDRQPSEMPVAQTIEVADSGQRQTLPDGTVVWLEEGSTLAMGSDFMSDRRVSLTGNATFEVTKISGKHFTVELDGSEVVVKGTCFSIHENTDINVTLFSGAVEFVPGNGNDPVELKPSQRLTYVPESGDIAVRNIPASLRWENGVYKLSQIELPELVDFMETRYDVKITLAGNLRNDNLRMTGMLRYDEPLDSILQRICYVFKLGYTCNGTRYVLAEETPADTGE